MIDKKNLLGITSLKLSGVVDTLNDSAYSKYCELLDTFVDNFPLQEAALKAHFKAGAWESFLSVHAELKELLVKLYAEDLAAKCDGLLANLKDVNRDMAEASLSYFLTTVSMLSIEIQMAKHKQGIAAAAVSAAPAAAPAPANLQKTILAVDDVPLLLSTLRAALQDAEYKFTGVTSGEAALKFLGSHKADLFLLDIEMPGMNGYDLAQRIKAAGHTAPIIFLTGNSKREYVLKAMQIGAVDFIVKPINKEQVLGKIKKYI